MDVMGGTILAAPAQTDYGTFCLPYPDNVFQMSGGTLNIMAGNTSSPAVRTKLC